MWFKMWGTLKLDANINMNILVTGANGQLGNEIQIVSKKSKDTYIFTDVCDL